MKNLLLIINPIAGTKKSVKNLTEIISVFNRAGFDVHTYITAGKGDAKKAAEEMAKSSDVIVCCGGDGTLNETISGIIDGGFKVPIGYIPSGSTNDFAASLKLENDIIKAAERIVKGNKVSIDIGKFGDRYFTYIASFGAFTKASYSTPQNVKNTLGHMAYILEGIQELSNIRKFFVSAEIDGKKLEDEFIFGAVCNSTSVGGILTLDAKLVDMSDGKFEVILIKQPKDLVELHECAVSLTKQNYDCNMITLLSAQNVKVTTEEKLNWSLDGEKAENVKEIEIEILHNRIEFIY